MVRQQVSSSCIRSIGYDAMKSILEIEFVSGSVYRYFGVPQKIHHELIDASSHGTYFNAEIKDVYRSIKHL
ncbi:MAG: KTSC domain-containing protein [Candidatus Cloacimonetes bacterium]|nr:KTSC domain-containing protein [Candidatus Cloacimonadota bacterium]